MCNPGLAIMGTQAAGAAMSTVGAIFGASSQKSSLKYQAQMADINARIAEGNARNLISAGLVEESRIKMAGSQAKGAQIARMASSGIDIAGSPTAQARLAGTDLITEVDANTMRLNALRAAWGQRFEAGDQRNRAEAARASAASISPAMAGLTSLMNGVGQVAASWYTLNREGAFSGGAGSSAPARRGMVTVESDPMWPEADNFPAPFSAELEGYQAPTMLRVGRGY